MNLSYYSVGALRANYRLDPKETAQINRSIRTRLTKILMQYFTDDCDFDVRTPWGPDAHVIITVAKFDSSGTKVVKDAVIEVTPSEDSETPLPVQASWAEWQNVTLEGLVKVCTNAYHKSTNQLSIEIIDKIKNKPDDDAEDKPAIETRGGVDIVGYPSKAIVGMKANSLTTQDAIDAFGSALISGSPRVLPASGDCFTIVTGDVFNTAILQRQKVDVMATPHEVNNGLYGKKSLRLKEGAVPEFSFVDREPLEYSPQPARKPSLIKRIISLLIRR